MYRENTVRKESAEPGRVAAKALVNAGRELGLSQRDVAGIVGVSEASVSRMRAGGYALAGKPLELALCLIRVFRSLDAISGGEADTMRGWIASPNADLGGVPGQLMQSAAGLVDVMNYLDAARAPT